MNRQKLSAHTLMCLLACAATACSSDLDQKESPVQREEGERITVTATADMPQGQPSTRVDFEETTDGTNKLKLSWRPIDDPKGPETFSILSGAAHTTHSTFTMQSMDASGAATFTGEIIPADGTTYYAVYPALTAAATVPATAIPLDMTGQTGALDESKMYMYGSSAYTAGDALNFGFQHLTSIVKATLKFPETLKGKKASAVTFTATTGLYTNAVADITAGTATYSNQTTGSLALSSTFNLSNDANAETTVYLHVLPGTLTNFKVTAEGDGKMIYIGTISASTQIETGKMYTAPVEMKDPLADAKVGDFYCKGSDGNGYLIPGDAATLTEEQQKACVGIVFWVGSEALDEDILLKRDHPDCSHGLVVALQDADGGNTMNWSKQNESVQKELSDKYKSAVNLLEDTKMCGYSNTLALMDYNATKDASDDLRVLPCDAIKKYSNSKPAPKNSSGWYFPSIMELKHVCWGQENANGTAGMKKLNEQITKVSGIDIGSDSYWSSTEHSNFISAAWYVPFGNGTVNFNNKSLGDYRVRPLLVF